MADKIKQRRDTQANWEAVNPILDQGELGWITDRNTGKLGDGTHGFNELSIIQGTPESWVNVKDFGAKGDGIHDDTQAIQASLDTGKTVFIPRGTYIVHDLIWNYRNNIYGSGMGTILKNNISNSTLLLINVDDSWEYNGLFNLTLMGNMMNNGVDFLKAESGRIFFSNVHFFDFDKTIFKSKGNIGNIYYNCYFVNSNYHWYSQPSIDPVMHAGSEYFLYCDIKGAKVASIYLKDTIGNLGPVTFDNCHIGGNSGFGIFLDRTGSSQDCGITLETVYLEHNGTASSIILDGLSYEPTDIYAKGTEQLIINNSGINSIQLENSYVISNYCKFRDEASRPLRVYLTNSDIKGLNTIIYHNNDNFLIHSIGNVYPTEFNNAIFMPPRDKLVNISSNNLKFSNHFNASTPTTIIGDYSSTPTNDSILHTYSSEFTVTFDNDAAISIPTTTQNKYTVIIANIKVISGSLRIHVTGHREFANLTVPDHLLNQWISFVGIGYNDIPYSNYIYLHDESGTASTFRINDLQMFEFDTKIEALNFINSFEVFSL